MELLKLKETSITNNLFLVKNEDDTISSDKHFIEANTISVSQSEISENHIIPVFLKDNEVLISHTDFIETVMDVAKEIFPAETILKPNIRVSHAIKGRVPEAKNKSVKELLEHEKTLYFERMAFIIEIPSIQDDVAGNTLNLTVGGIKAYNLDNLYCKKGVDEHFKIFIGFKNQVCTNLCVWTDGFFSDVKVKTTEQLKASIQTLFENYNAAYQLHSLRTLNDFTMTEQEFAHLIGMCRMYQHLPNHIKKDIPKMTFGDNQIGMICKDYYRDESFCKDANGNINLWRLYNLFTGSNKSSYIENFLDKSANAYHFIDEIRTAKANKTFNWFLS